MLLLEIRAKGRELRRDWIRFPTLLDYRKCADACTYLGNDSLLPALVRGLHNPRPDISIAVTKTPVRQSFGGRGKQIPARFTLNADGTLT